MNLKESRRKTMQALLQVEKDMGADPVMEGVSQPLSVPGILEMLKKTQPEHRLPFIGKSGTVYHFQPESCNKKDNWWADDYR